MDFLWKNGDPWSNIYKETYYKGEGVFTAMTENGSMHVMDFSTNAYTRVPNFHQMDLDHATIPFTSVSIFTSCGFIMNFFGTRWRASTRILAVAHGNVVEELGPMWTEFGPAVCMDHPPIDCLARYCINTGLHHEEIQEAQTQAQDNAEA
jgi:hypothetical protein